MIPGRVAGATRNLGAPPDWVEDEHGIVSHLPILDTVEDGIHWMTSVWHPFPEELEALAKGGAVILRIQGVSHPVVSVGASVPPEPLPITEDPKG